MATKTTHTPLPWEVGERIGDGSPVVTYQARDIATVENYYGDGEANAELIVRAVNAHDDLLAACKALMKQIEDHDPAGCIEGKPYDRLAQARAAIRKAEAE